MRLKNTDVATRIYNDLQRADGTTLELGPGDEANVEVPEGLVEGIKNDPFLKIVAGSKRKDVKAEQEQPANA